MQHTNSPFVFNLVFQIIIILFFVVIPPATYAQSVKSRYVIDKIDHHDVRPAQLSSLFLDKQGYLWFGSFSGITRFDGVESRVLDSSHGLSNNNIMDITGDDQGNLFIATYGGGLSILRNNSFREVPLDKGVTIEYINDLHLADNGILWIASFEGLFTWDGTLLREHTTRVSDDVSFYSIHQMADGAMLFGTEEQVIICRNNTCELFGIDDEASDYPYVYALDEDSSGNIYVGTELGLYLLEPDTWKGGYKKCRKILDCSAVQNILVSDSGIWISTLDGLFLYDFKDFTRFDSSDGLSSSTVHMTFKSPSGTLWVATDSGLNKITKSYFSVINSKNGLPSDLTNSLYEDPGGNIWAATESGVARILDKRAISVVCKEQGLHNGYTLSVTGPDPDNLYIVDYNGLYHWDGTRAKRIPTSYYPGMVYTDSRGIVWLPGSIGVSHLIDGVEVPFPENHPLANLYVNNMTEDRHGNLWFATSNKGIVIWDGLAAKQYDSRDGFTNQDIWSIDFDSSGTAWIGTNGDGLYSLKDGQFKRYTKEANLSSNFVWQVICAPDDKVWLNTNKGIDVWKDGLLFHFNESDGLAMNEGVSGSNLISDEGNLYFGSEKGISVIPYTTVPDREVSFPIYITAMTVNNALKDISRNHSLSYDQNTVQFDYAGIYLRNPRAVRYSYRLSGSYPDWSIPSPKRSVTFVGLPPGEYTFQVKASIDSGLSWITIQSPVQFSIQKPFFQTWWFLLLILIGLSFLVISFFNWRMQYTQKMNQSLQKTVDQQTKSIRTAMDKLQSSADMLARKNADLELFNAAISHDLISPLSRIQGFSDLLLDSIRERRDDSLRFATRIQSNSIRTIKLVRALQNLYKVTKGEYKTERVDLSLLVYNAVELAKYRTSTEGFDLSIARNIVVHSDPELLEIVLNNLIQNAFKYCSKERTLKISFDRKLSEGEEVFCVTDNGIGLRSDQLKVIFNLSNRQHPDKDDDGSGIGLATCKKIIEQLGGRIWAESEPDKGSAFCFTLQASENMKES